MKITFKNPTLCQSLDKTPFVIIDVGARRGLRREWLSLKSFIRSFSFEPEPDEFSHLQSLSKTNQLIFNQGAWNKDTTHDLKQAKDPGLSSCKRPNPEFLKSFDTSTAAGFQTVKNIPIKVNTLDSMIPQDYQQIIDFIKIDIEGGSWEALNGTTDLLSNNIIHALNLECEYNPKWKDQYLFGEVDTFLRKYHYQLYNAKNLQWKRTAGLRSGTSRTGQLVHGDFFHP